MRVVGIVQARVGSTRLPGKVLRDIAGQTMLERVLGRARKVASIDQVVVATSVEAGDDAVVRECERLGVPVHRGSELDVLRRYYDAAAFFEADVVVRMTADCPLLDPMVSHRIVTVFLDESPDYASNSLQRTYPQGLDTEVFTFGALHAAEREAKESYERAHVTPFIYRHPERFRLRAVTCDFDASAHRWTVDTADDLRLVQTIYEKLGPAGTFGWRDALSLVEASPEIAAINRHVRQKALEAG